MSIFAKTKQDIISEELIKSNYDDIIDNNLNIRTINIDEELELLMYDIKDAIISNDIIMCESCENNEEAYLIPIIFAYQNAKSFKHFIIATSSQEKLEKIKFRLTELSQSLNIDIPIHTISKRDNYLCIRRLEKRIKRENEELYITTRIDNKIDPEKYHKEDFEHMSDAIWKKIHVTRCNPCICRYRNDCHYYLQHQALNSEGATIVFHEDIIDDSFHENDIQLNKNSDLVIIDEAQLFSDNIRKKYTNDINLGLINDYLPNALRVLSKQGTLNLNFSPLNLINTFFELCYKEKDNKYFMRNEKLQTLAKQITSILETISINLTRPVTRFDISQHIDKTSEVINVLIDFFKNFSQNTKYVYSIEEKETKKRNHLYHIKLCYYSKKVDEIISDSLNKYNSSIVFTGKNIAGNDSEYTLLCDDVGATLIKKTIIKEFS